jgi:hypothetical protein
MVKVRRLTVRMTVRFEVGELDKVRSDAGFRGMSFAEHWRVLGRGWRRELVVNDLREVGDGEGRN